MKDFLNGFIDPKRIIDGKKSRIQKDYEQLCENYNVTNSIEFLTKIRNYPLSEILENSYYIHKEPRGTDFLNYVLKTNDLKQEDIQLQMITVNKTLQNNNLSNSHISKLNECLNILKEKEKKINDINYIKESIKYDLITSSISRPLLESPVINDLDIIIQNINYQPEIIEKYEEMIQEIKKWKAKTILTNFVPLLVKNTVLIAGITVLLVGSALTLIVSLPLLLVSKLIEERIDRRYISTFVYVISKEIKKVEELIQMSDIKKKKMLEEYAYSLKSARERLMKYDIYAKKFKGVRESHIGQMQPNPYHDTIAEMEKEIDDLIEEANSELEWKPVVEAVNAITIGERKDVSDEAKRKFVDLYFEIRDFIINDEKYSQLFYTNNEIETKEDLFNSRYMSSYIVTSNKISEQHPIELLIEIVNKIFEKFEFIEIEKGIYCHKDYPEIRLIFNMNYSIQQEFEMNIGISLMGACKSLNSEFYRIKEEPLQPPPPARVTEEAIEIGTNKDKLDKFLEIATDIQSFIIGSSYSNLTEYVENDLKIDTNGGCLHIWQSKPIEHPNYSPLAEEIVKCIANKFGFVQITPGVYRHEDYLFIELTYTLNKHTCSCRDTEHHKNALFNITINLAFINDGQKIIETIKTPLENAIYIKICDFIFDEREDNCLESFKKITDLVTKYEQLIILEEGADESRKSLSRKVALKAEVAAKKSIKKLRDMKTKGQHTTAVLKRVPRHIEDFINNTLNKLKEMDRTERRNRIIEGTVRKKLMKVIRDAIVLGVTWAINPAISAITLIAGVAIDKMTDKKVRHQILHELELELKIVDEKLEDARSDGSRRKKYELMRIKHKLEREIDRIRYNLGA